MSFTETRKTLAPRLVWPIALMSMLMLLVVACGGDDDDDDEDVREVTGLSDCTVAEEGYYYIAEMMPFTGSLGAFGPTLENAILQAAKDINDEGGIDGHSVGVISCDTGTDPTMATDAMAEIGAASPVGVVVGAAASSCTLGAADEAIAAGKVLVSPSSTSPAITDIADDDYVWRTCVSDAVQGVIASKIAQREGFGTVFVINRDDAYGNGLREAFTDDFTGAGGTVDYVTYDEQDVEYEQTVVDAAMAATPDAVFLISFVDDGAAILKNAANQAWDDPAWIIPDGPKDEELAEKVDDDAYLDGALGTSPAAPVGDDYDAFESDYVELWGESPNVFNSNGYDATFMAAIAMALSGDPDDGTAIRDALPNTSSGTVVRGGGWADVLDNLSAGEMNYEGASGDVNFDENGDVLSRIEEWTFQDGEIITVECWEPDGTTCQD